MRANARGALHRATAVCLALLLLWQANLSAVGESLSGVSVESAPLTSASAAQDGMVRVYLSSLGNPASLTLTVAGSYSLSTGTALGSGETLAVGFSSSTGAITLTRGGVKTNMGTYFSLRRHSATGSNGILIAQARKPSNPYPGDISFQSVAQSGGGYKLYTVAHIYMENYLYGVLPYEMGSGASAEALKAQAVAARTYTVRMMASRASGYYDVVDTTSDQVYNGTPSGNSACEAAVNATKGIVLKNGGAYTATYYAASNGGQTESILNIWGTAGLSYLGVKDDPFDYANPDSTVKKTTVYADAASTLNNAALMALLKTKAIAGLAAVGYAATVDNTTLTTIRSITPHTPMYASPSKLYTKLDFAMTASTRTSGGAAATATVTVTCGIFTELETLLGMSIQNSKNELWSVVASGSSFSIQARRYGHGLGLSQRGAMYMGKLGYTYDKILGFYFDGSTRVGCTFTNTILAAGSSDVLTTEEAAAAIDETTGDGSATGVVKLASSAASLAIRASKSTTGAMLGVAPGSSPVAVYTSDGTWCLIGFGSIVGYVPASALTITGTPPATSDKSVSTVEGFGTVTASGYLNLRSSGSYSASVVTTAPVGAVLTVFSRSGGWARVQYGATAAYASTDYLRFSTTYSGAAVSSGSTTAYVTAESGAVAALRDAASTSANVLTQLTAGTEVSVTRDDGSWAYVTVGSQSGYLLSANLTYSDASTGDDTGSGGTTAEPTATVSANAGYLRVSADETSAMIMTVAMGQTVVLVGKGDTWSAVRYEGVTGYMLTASLNIPNTDTGTQTTATVVTDSGSLNMRMEARAGSTVVTTIPQGATVTVTSRGETWSAVSYGAYSGYVMSAYLRFASGSGTGGGQTNASTATVTTQSGSLNLRQQPKAGSTILRTIPQSATVAVSTYGTEWCAVVYEGTSGYAMTAFLTLAGTATTATPTLTATPTPTPTLTDGATATDTAATTPTVTLTATPTVAGALTAIVSTESGSLNLRADMLPGSRILTRIPKGTTVTITQKLSAWSEAVYEGYTGYVMNSFLTFAGDAGTVTGEATAATVLTASGSLNLRAEPYGKVLLTIPQGTTVTVLSRGGTWCFVSYAGISGYAMTAYLSFTDSSATATPTPTPSASGTATDTGGVTPSPSPTATATATAAGTLTATVLTPSGSLNLRASSSTGAQIVTTIPRLSTVTVLAKGDTWTSVVYSAYMGYVQSAYLSYAGDASAVTATPASTDGVAAWVVTTSGSLNLRASASTSATILTTIPRLAQVTLFSQDATWCGVRYGAYSGYAMTAYLTTTRPAELVGATTQATQTDTATASTATTQTSTSTPTPTPTANTTTDEDPTLKAPDAPLYATITPKDSAATLPLWVACSQDQGRLLDMLAGAQLQVLRRGDTWCEVLYFEQKGFCLTEGLTMLAQ